jgi:hypothetical protein
MAAMNRAHRQVERLASVRPAGRPPAASRARPDRGGPVPDIPAHLRVLASRVVRLGLAGRFDPESAYAEREEVSYALQQLARELERPQEPPPVARAVMPATARAALVPERLLALLAAKTREISHLQALLAQAAQPQRRRQRQHPAQRQLTLDLPETCDARALSAQPARRRR